MNRRRAFDGLTNRPCSVCLELSQEGQIQPRAIMPLPEFPATLKSNDRQCCRDCAATELTQRLGNHPDFGPARLAVANERIEGMTMPLGVMESLGLCKMRWIDPCSSDDLEGHIEWLEENCIPNSCDVMRWGQHESE